MENCNCNNNGLTEIQKKLDSISNRLQFLQRTAPDQVIFDNQDFIQIMNISKRTAQEWRNENLIGYSQIGGKVYYRLSDIIELLNRFYKPFKP